MMRSPNPVKNQPQISASEQWLSALQDLVSQVQIHSQFLICHPDYIPLEVPVDLIGRFQQLPAALQRKYQSWQLRNFLYDIYFSGTKPVNLTLDANAANSPPSLEHTLDLKNNKMRGLNLEFYEQLHNENSGNGYFDSEWCVLRQESDGSLAVQKQNLTVHIERDRHLQPSEQLATVGDMVAIHLPRNCLEAGLYIAVSNAGLPSDQCLPVEIYFNVDAPGAIALMQHLTQHLNAMSIAFCFKVPSSLSAYRCYNSSTLRIESRHYERVRQLLQSLDREVQFSAGKTIPEQFERSVPLFTKYLAPQLQLAESPAGTLANHPKDFGLNRCQVVANALLAAWDNGDQSPEGRIEAIQQHFSQHGIAWQSPYLNANSEDIYTPFD
jgi:hypothetical protein